MVRFMVRYLVHYIVHDIVHHMVRYMVHYIVQHILHYIGRQSLARFRGDDELEAARQRGGAGSRSRSSGSSSSSSSSIGCSGAGSRSSTGSKCGAAVPTVHHAGNLGNGLVNVARLVDQPRACVYICINKKVRAGACLYVYSASVPGCGPRCGECYGKSGQACAH